MTLKNNLTETQMPYEKSVKSQINLPSDVFPFAALQQWQQVFLQHYVECIYIFFSLHIYGSYRIEDKVHCCRTAERKSNALLPPSVSHKY